MNLKVLTVLQEKHFVYTLDIKKPPQNKNKLKKKKEKKGEEQKHIFHQLGMLTSKDEKHLSF